MKSRRAGKILFLEDVDEEPYSIDRMLTHLRLAGKFDGVAGVIFGECQDCRPKDYKPSTTIPYGLGEVLDNILRRSESAGALWFDNRPHRRSTNSAAGRNGHARRDQRDAGNSGIRRPLI